MGHLSVAGKSSFNPDAKIELFQRHVPSVPSLEPISKSSIPNLGSLQPISKASEDLNLDAKLEGCCTPPPSLKYFQRCDVANGLVTEDEIRLGVSERDRDDPMYRLDMVYIEHLRQLRGFSVDRVRENATVFKQDKDVKAEALYFATAGLPAIHHHLPSCSFEKRKQIIRQNSEVSAAITAEGIDWPTHLRVNPSSTFVLASGTIQVAYVYNLPSRVTIDDCECITFVANGYSRISPDVYVSGPAIFVANVNDANAILSSIKPELGEAASLLVDFKSYQGYLGDLLIPEIFFISL